MSNQADADKPTLYALNWQENQVAFPFNKGTHTYTLRRPKKSTWEGAKPINETVEFFLKDPGESVIKRGGVREENAAPSGGYAWLFKRLVTSLVEVLPDANGQPVEKVYPISDELLDKIKGKRQEACINATCFYYVKPLKDLTEETLDGGVYFFDVYRGTSENDPYVGKFAIEYWDKAMRHEYRKSVVTRSHQEDDAIKTTTTVNYGLALTYFDKLVRDAEGPGVADESGNVRPALVDDLRKEADDFLKIDVMAAAIKYWEAEGGK
jgi:hypothetical protein